MKEKHILFLMLVLLFAGCGKETTPTETVAPDVGAGFKPAPTMDPSTVGTLKGKVLFEGQAVAPAELSVRGNPECAALHPGGAVKSEEFLVQNGALQNVFVYIKEGLESYQFDPPQQAVTIENKNCLYVPHVAGAQVNQPVILLNSDPTLHNIHSYSKKQKPWNLGLPFAGMKQTKKFEAAEVMVQLKCDVHPWMLGYVGVLPHPYFAVTDANGEFQIKDLPPGEYTLEAWHEKLGAQSQKLTIEPRAEKAVEFKFSV